MSAIKMSRTAESCIGSEERSCGKICAEDIISELAVIAFADMTDFVEICDGNVQPRDMRLIPPEKRRAVASIKNGTGSKGAEIKLYDKMKALELLGRYFGVFDSSTDSSETLERLDEIITMIDESADKDGGL